MPAARSRWFELLAAWLGFRPRSEFELAVLAERGLPTETLRFMANHGLTPRELDALVIPQRTLKHRRSRNEALSREESDRAIRTARVLASAQTVFGTSEKALGWMRNPKRRFDGRTPMDMLVTGAGSRLVEEMLVQIDEGIFA